MTAMHLHPDRCAVSLLRMHAICCMCCTALGMLATSYTLLEMMSA